MVILGDPQDTLINKIIHNARIPSDIMKRNKRMPILNKMIARKTINIIASTFM